MTPLYEQVTSWLAANSKPRQMVHFERTAYWIKQLKPDADEAMLIAAIAHDAERVFREIKGPMPSQSLHDPDYLGMHQEDGAKLVGEFLKKNGADTALIERVNMLISKHEEGGTPDQDLIMDADSISFLENNVDHFIDQIQKVYGREKVKEKFTWMYGRMSSNKAKKIAKVWYERAMKLVE